MVPRPRPAIVLHPREVQRRWDIGSSACGRSWTSSGGGATSVTVSGGTLTVGGAGVFSVQTATNTGVEGRVAFGGSAYQHFGLATGLSTEAGNYWAMFSTRGTTGRLYARVNANGSITDGDLGDLPTGFHTYKVQPTGSVWVAFSDGL